MSRALGVALAALALGGCAWLRDDAEPLIGSLEQAPVVVEPGAAAAADRDEVIDNYRALLALEPERRLASEATRRLADLELDRAETRLLERPEPGPAAAGLGSIALYETLLADDPDYAGRDRVLYQLARAYELAGDPARMMQTLDRLVADHPDGAHWAEAQFRRGERLFVERRFVDAEAAYGALLARDGASPFFDRALFKHGWARFKQQRIEAGLDSFTRLLDRKLNDLPDGDTAQLSAADRELLKETLRVISLTFAELGGTDQIGRYFARRGHRGYEYMVYRGLGDLYVKQRRFQDAAAAWLAFVALDPGHREAPRLAVAVIDLYAANDFPQQALESKKAFTRRYRVQGPHWQQLEATDRDWLSAQLRTHLKALAEYHHALFQQIRPDELAKAKRTEALAARTQAGDEAVDWYGRYLDAFPGEAASGEIGFLLAELLSELGRHRKAVTAYEASAYDHPPHAKSAEAGYAALLAYSAAEKGLAQDQLAGWRRQGIDSALRFAERFPDESRRAAALTQAADQLLALGELESARTTALRVTAITPPAGPGLLRTAWTVAAHAAFDLARYPDAEAAYDEALERIAADDPGRDAVRERLAAAIYQQGIALRDGGDPRGAAAQFLRVAQRVPDAAIGEAAEFDAATSLIAAGMWPRTIEILERFRTRYPQSARLPAIAGKLALAYLENDQPLRAASELTTIARDGATPELKREAGWQAAELYDKADAAGDAIAAYERYLDGFPEPLEQAVEARQRLAELNDQAGDGRRRDHWLREIVAADRTAGNARTDRTRFLAAHAALRLARPTHEAFSRIALKAPLKRNLKRKKAQMERAIAAFDAAASYAVAEVTTAATFHTGELYREFGLALMESERPAGLDADALEQYEILLEEQAFPFEEKAIAIHEANSRRAAEGIYDRWVAQSFAALARLLPARYAKQEKAEAQVDAIN